MNCCELDDEPSDFIKAMGFLNWLIHYQLPKKDGDQLSFVI
jgi:hypothetical protein